MFEASFQIQLIYIAPFSILSTNSRIFLLSIDNLRVSFLASSFIFMYSRIGMSYCKMEILFEHKTCMEIYMETYIRTSIFQKYCFDNEAMKGKVTRNMLSVPIYPKILRILLLRLCKPSSTHVNILVYIT